MKTVINHPLYEVREEEYNEEFGRQFDWVDAVGEDSPDWFGSVEEAEDDIRARIGLTSDIVVLTKVEYEELLEYKFRYEGLDK